MSILFTSTEQKILKLTLKDDYRVQQHYSHLFGCHYLPDIIQHLRRKLERLFSVDDGKCILATEYHKVIKIDGKKATIGIYRLEPSYKSRISEHLNKDAIDEVNSCKN